ncbi:MAG: 2-succinyl-5-enolpyruvyl-6-hydroxy-3-cyclohexene-1-carboxylic-acid synthase [Melioribacteraceae bacterium]|nr:2-succinyl-5-enolpyruvyl-6-hydroxy-3-cyclohexene-1-carboxylic-acid synthase [Melioribacteraceae bacterium]
MKKFINHNFLLADYVVRSLLKIGVRDVVISPGSRSTPLVQAASQHKKLKKHVVIDERSNAYFALGLAKSGGKPVAVVTTSGTAVAELYPAVIEAYYQRIPLIICSADRPEHLINKGANQTIDQRNIFANHIKCFVDSGVCRPHINYFKNLNKKLQIAFDKLIHEDRGPVQLNLRFEKPLEKSSSTLTLSGQRIIQIYNMLPKAERKKKIFVHNNQKFLETISRAERKLIMIGPALPLSVDKYTILKIAKELNALIIYDGLSGLRYGSEISNFILHNATAFARNRSFLDKFDADLILQFNDAPTSNILQYFFKNSRAYKVLINESGDVKDPSGSYNKMLRMSSKEFLSLLTSGRNKTYNNYDPKWYNDLITLNKSSQQLKEKYIYRKKYPSEPRIVKELTDTVPSGSKIMISNSLPPRDFDYFGDCSEKQIRIFHNRGTSGIDGIISTAAGVINYDGDKGFLVIGDIAFAHDLNGLWLLSRYKIPLKIILINNGGGSIFEMLPVFREKLDFGKYFKVPSGINYRAITRSFNGYYKKINSWSEFRNELSKRHSTFSVLEIKSNSLESHNTRLYYWEKVISATERFINEDTY